MQLYEKYRPTRLNDVLGQDKVIARLRQAQKRGWGGKAYWIQGKSGTGKTTIAKIIAAQECDTQYIVETVGRDLTANKLRDIAYNWNYTCFTERQGQALIVNEAHGLSKPVIELFLDILESLRSKVVVIFTTTIKAGELFEEHVDASPFKSRCVTLHLTTQGLAPLFAKRAKEIAETEGLDGKPLSSYLTLANNTQSNMREMLTEIEAGAMLP